MAQPINQKDLQSLYKKLAFLQSYDKKELSRELSYTASQIDRRAKKSAPVDTGNLRQSIGYEVGNKKISVFARANYAPYIEFGTGGGVDLSDMQQLGIPDSYAAQFKGKGEKVVNFPARPFFFSSVRYEYKQPFQRISKNINKRLK